MSQQKRILIVDDEPQIRKFLEISLRAQGYVVVQAETGEAGLAALATQGADLVILDIGLPDRDGHAVLRELRQWSHVPVIMLSARGAEAHRVLGLELGADDYLAKPFSMLELLARVRALLRRIDQLRALNGAAFDREFLSRVVDKGTRWIGILQDSKGKFDKTVDAQITGTMNGFSTSKASTTRPASTVPRTGSGLGVLTPAKKKMPKNRNSGRRKKFSQFSWWNERMYDVMVMPIDAKAKAIRIAAGMPVP